MSSKILLAVLTACSLTSAAAAETIYLDLTCLVAPAGARPYQTFHGTMIVQREDLRLSETGIVVTGRDLAISPTQIQSTNCRNTYSGTESYWFEGDWRIREVSGTRNWNALRAHMASRVSFRTCDRGSELNIYDSREAYLTDIYRDHRGTDEVSTISRRECLIDDLDRAE